MSECVVKQLISRTDSLRNIIMIVVLHVVRVQVLNFVVYCKDDSIVQVLTA